MDNILIKIITDETFLTILSGVIVFIISQIIFEFIIKPREEFNKLKGEIICCLTVKEASSGYGHMSVYSSEFRGNLLP